MKLKLLFTIFLFSIWIPQAFSQSKHGNIWIFGKDGLDFNQVPAKFTTEGSHRDGWWGNATIADERGELLFYSEGQNIWNKLHQVMANGTGLAGHYATDQGVIIVPKPGSKTLFYIFTSDAYENKWRNGLRYSLVDMSKQDGLGEVITKNVFVQEMAEENIAVTGSCNCPQADKFWLTADKQDQPGYLFTYLIDKDGIHSQPVSSFLPGVSHISQLKFSPAGDKIAILGKDINEKPVVAIAVFNFNTGVISQVKFIPTFPDHSEQVGAYLGIEFSGNGKFLYLASNRLKQFDITQPTEEQIGASGKVIISIFPSGFMAPQLAPDGKIYILTQMSGITDHSLSTIEKPNLPGTASSIRVNKIQSHSGHLVSLPNFVSTFFYRNDTLTANANAGQDKEVCVTKSVRLGGDLSKSLSYRWSPATYLDDSTAANPVFQYRGPLTTIKTLQYVLKVQDGYCYRQDTVQVTVHPLPQTPVAGSRSVCPGVAGVVYETAPVAGHTYRWRVNGGTITAGQGTSRITVDWAETNPDAWVEVTATNQAGCADAPTVLPVRINVKLETETPWGLSQVCLNQRENTAYQVTSTTGSVYTWGLQGGTLVAGQGTARVAVNWSTAPPHKIWLQEQSTTRDTVCFGTSDTLQVTIFRDTTTLALQNVSVSLADASQVEVSWASSDAGRLPGPLTLWRRRLGTTAWSEAGTHATAVMVDAGLSPEETIYEYQVSGLNGCQEPVTSKTHHTIQLQGEVRENDGKIILNWNAYQGWPQGVERYEIWRQLDDEQELKLVGQVTGGLLTYSDLSSTAGFAHQYRIKAVARGSALGSWSNPVSYAFSHDLSPPNVLTPNGDGQNDTFVIRLLELYPDNQLTIYNRWGQQVLKAEGYNNNWSAANVPAGTYFYNLLLPKTGKRIKGWVEVVR